MRSNAGGEERRRKHSRALNSTETGTGRARCRVKWGECFGVRALWDCGGSAPMASVLEKPARARQRERSQASEMVSGALGAEEVEVVEARVVMMVSVCKLPAVRDCGRT